MRRFCKSLLVQNQASPDFNAPALRSCRLRHAVRRRASRRCRRGVRVAVTGQRGQRLVAGRGLATLESRHADGDGSSADRGPGSLAATRHGRIQAAGQEAVRDALPADQVPECRCRRSRWPGSTSPESAADNPHIVIGDGLGRARASTPTSVSAEIPAAVTIRLAWARVPVRCAHGRRPASAPIRNCSWTGDEFFAGQPLLHAHRGLSSVRGPPAVVLLPWRLTVRSRADA